MTAKFSESSRFGDNQKSQRLVVQFVVGFRPETHLELRLIDSVLSCDCVLLHVASLYLLIYAIILRC